MNRQDPLNSVDSLLCQAALQTRELSQKKNGINQQIKVCRADIAERRSLVEALHGTIKTLEEEIRAKQSTVVHHRANAKREVYEERIARYRKIFLSNKEYYCQSPLAQKLLSLQAEKEEIECRIKACDDQITRTQTELDRLTVTAVTTSSAEKLPDSVTGQQPTNEPEKQLDPQPDSDSAIDTFCLHLNQTKMLQSGHEVSGEASAGDIPEEHMVQDAPACRAHPEEAGTELWSHEQLDEQSWPDEMQTNEQEKETELEHQVLEQQSNVSEVEEAVGDKVEETADTDEDQTPSEKDNEGLADFLQSSSQGSNCQSCLAKTTTAPSTPAFPFNLSPNSSPHGGTSDTKSPAFLFSLNSDPSTPGFSGFGFDMGTSDAEDTSFGFTGSFFNEKAQSFCLSNRRKMKTFSLPSTSRALRQLTKRRPGMVFHFHSTSESLKKNISNGSDTSSLFTFSHVLIQ
ncbi:putative protein SIX6OS1 isoform 4 [Scophthalmus maximus]|uniref:Uncharacterized protein n=1 Tax=Scophthalmus maximus TaxID=52904 RepID=A0A2U9CDP4_SCOMX|nr:putative protein SIX6OS1 isoform 4 [Scophthalmus maximus]